jgi:hypothetical protein
MRPVCGTPAGTLGAAADKQWRQSGFAGGALDVASVAERDLLGVRTRVWGSDYPHAEETYPHTAQQLANVFAGVPDEEVDAMCAGNAARLFGFDLDELSKTPAAQVPWPQPATLDAPA